MLAADWLLLRARLVRQQSVASVAAWTTALEKDVKKKAEKSYHCYGGAWRAFMSNWLKTHHGGQFEAAVQEYHRVKEEDGQDYAYWKELGRQATAAAHAGGRAFGDARAARRAERRPEQAHIAASRNCICAFVLVLIYCKLLANRKCMCYVDVLHVGCLPILIQFPYAMCQMDVLPSWFSCIGLLTVALICSRVALMD